MTDAFDALSRVLATPVARGQRLRLMRLAVGEGAASHRQLSGEFDLVKMVARLRSAYLARDSYIYRMGVFSTLLFLRGMDGNGLQRVLDKLIADVVRNGADGVETLLLACADGIATQGDAETKRRARASLAALSGNLRFLSRATPPNLKVPLSRLSAYLVLDVRADAVRTLLIELAQQSRSNQDVPSLLDLLDARETRDALCDLPLLPNQTGNISLSDSSRQSNCEASGSAGSDEGGTVEGALGRLISSGCNLILPEEVDTLVARVVAADKCFATRSGRQPYPNLTLDPVSVIIGAVLGAAMAVATGVAANLLTQKVLGSPAEWQRYREELEDAGEAMRDAVKAARKAQEAADALAEAESRLDYAQDQLTKAEEALQNATTEEEVEAAQEWVTEARAAHEEAKKAAEKAREEKEEADEAAADAEDKAREKAKEAEEERPETDLDPDDPFSSEACREAMGDPSDRVVAERLGQDWTAWNETRGRLPHLWDPAPEDLQPYDSLRLPRCGDDDATVSNLAENCDVPVECLEGTPDAACGCAGAPTDAARLVGMIAASACREAQCEDGADPQLVATAQGVVCVCGEVGEEGPRKPFGPAPPGPTPPVIAVLFGNGATPMPRGDSLTSRLVGTLFQDLGRNRSR